MNTNTSIENDILHSANIITNIHNLDEEISQFIKGIILILCDKFVKDELLSIEITNNRWKNENNEDYAQRKVDAATKKLKEEMEQYQQEMKQRDKKLILNLDKKGFRTN